MTAEGLAHHQWTAVLLFSTSCLVASLVWTVSAPGASAGKFNLYRAFPSLAQGILTALRRKRQHEAGTVEGLHGLIGSTPLVKIASLSKQTGCEVGTNATGYQWCPDQTLYILAKPDCHVTPIQVYGKAEMLNPGGSVKDRVALQIMQEAFASGRLKPGGLITEGTAGSTGKLCM